jgi:hypothetical protein
MPPAVKKGEDTTQAIASAPSASEDDDKPVLSSSPSASPSSSSSGGNNAVSHTIKAPLSSRAGKIADRLSKAVEEMVLAYNRSPELVPLTADYERMKKNLRHLVNDVKIYQKRALEMRESKAEVSVHQCETNRIMRVVQATMCFYSVDEQKIIHFVRF